MKQFLTTIMFLCCLGASAASTVIPDMKFRRLDSRDGLSNSQINYMFQDSKGVIWIGTSYGLNRYDGYRFRTFYSDPNDTTTLRNNYVDLIWEDHLGRFWLRQGMNYSIFDPVTEHVIRNPSSELAKWGIKGGVDRFFIDSQKKIWVKTYDEGMYCYNPKTEKLTLIKYGYGDNEIPHDFWVSSFGNFGDKVLKDSFVKDNGGDPDQAYNLYVDQFDNIWVLSTHFFVYEQKAKRWHTSVNSYLATMDIPPLPDPLLVWDVCMDNRGWIWLVTDHEGLFVIDPKSKEVKQFVNNKFDTTSLSENTAKHLMLDKNGSMWISTYRNGVNQYIEKMVGFKTLELGDVNTTTVDTQGNYWLGTDNRGIIKYNPQTGESEIYDKARCGFASDIMVASYGARDGSVWFGTYNGGLIHIDNGHGFKC